MDHIWDLQTRSRNLAGPLYLKLVYIIAYPIPTNPGILRDGLRDLLPEDRILMFLNRCKSIIIKSHIFERMIFIYFIGYNPMRYFQFEAERLYYPIRVVYSNDYKRVSLSPSLKNCRVDVGISRYIGCNGSEAPFNNTNLFSIVPDRDPRFSPPYFLQVRLIMKNSLTIRLH